MSPAEQAVAELSALWQRWPSLDAAGRQAQVLELIRDGVLDRRSTTRGYQWCGATMAWAYRATLHPEIRAHLCPSTYRLSVAGRYARDPGIGWPYQRVARPGEQPVAILDYHREHGGLRQWWTGPSDRLQPGDVALVGGPPGGGGKHIVLVTEVEPGGVVALSGNGYGERSDGTTGGGVVRNRLALCDLRRVLRWAPADHDASLIYS